MGAPEGTLGVPPVTEASDCWKDESAVENEGDGPGIPQSLLQGWSGHGVHLGSDHLLQERRERADAAESAMHCPQFPWAASHRNPVQRPHIVVVKSRNVLVWSRLHVHYPLRQAYVGRKELPLGVVPARGQETAQPSAWLKWIQQDQSFPSPSRQTPERMLPAPGRSSHPWDQASPPTQQGSQKVLRATERQAHQSRQGQQCFEEVQSKGETYSGGSSSQSPK